MASHYDSFASEFSATRDRAWPEFEMLFGRMKKGGRVLDLGCGNGRLRPFLGTEMVAEGAYFGFDLSEKLLRIARDRYPKDHFFRGDFAETLPFGEDQFEVVAAVASFHHLLSKAEQIAFLAECFRVLRPGGTLFITTWILPRKYFWSNVLRGRWKNWVIPFGKEKHPRVYRKVGMKTLKRLVRKAGFTVVEGKRFEGRNCVVVGEK